MTANKLETNLSVDGNLYKDAHVEVQHSTSCEDSRFSALVPTDSLGTLTIFPETAWTCFVEISLDIKTFTALLKFKIDLPNLHWWRLISRKQIFLRMEIYKHNFLHKFISWTKEGRNIRVQYVPAPGQCNNSNYNDLHKKQNSDATCSSLVWRGKHNYMRRLLLFIIVYVYYYIFFYCFHCLNFVVYVLHSARNIGICD